MVVFICNACGQSVKKNQVEKHYQTVCRQCEVLSCIDCGKDFHGEEYNSHTSCISEAEKYQGKLYKPKDKQNKGEQKQQAWIKHVQNATSSGISDPRLAKLMEKLSAYDNIPRKRSKFENFCTNSVGVRDASLLSKLWDLFSEKPTLPDVNESAKGNSDGSDNTDHYSNVHENSKGQAKKDEVLDENVSEEMKSRKKHKDSSLPEQLDNKVEEKKKKKKHKKDKEICGTEQVNEEIRETSDGKKKRKKDKETCNGEQNGNVSHEEVVRKKVKKRKHEDVVNNSKNKKLKRQQDDNEKLEIDSTGETDHRQQVQHCGKFKWDSIIKRVLKETEDNEMKVKKLRKKVLAEFEAQRGDGKQHSDNELMAIFDKKINNNPKFKVHNDRVTLKR